MKTYSTVVTKVVEYNVNIPDSYVDENIRCTLKRIKKLAEHRMHTDISREDAGEEVWKELYDNITQEMYNDLRNYIINHPNYEEPTF